MADVTKELVKLAEKLGKVRQEEAEIVAKMQSLLGDSPQAAPSKRVSKPSNKGGKGAGREPGSGSMKALVLGILRDSDEPLQLKDITLKVSEAIENGEYETESENIGSLVSQAINSLKKPAKGEPLIVATPSGENNRNVYSALTTSEN